MPQDRKIVARHRRISSIVGSFSASTPIRLSTLGGIVACFSSSAMANKPIRTGMKWMPSYSSGWPKVKRSTPVVRSTPTVAIKTPIVPPMRFLIADLPLIDASIDSPKIVSAKYSGGPNS